MNSLARSTVRVLSNSKNISGRFDVNAALNRSLTRNIVVLATPIKSLSGLKKINHDGPCGCGCGIFGIHTKGDKDIVEFLQEEITAEKKNQVAGANSSSSGLADFDVQRSGAELTLTRNFNDEKVVISLNVNHSVDEEPAAGEAAEQEGQLLSKPDLEVDIKVGSKTLSFTLSYVTAEEMAEGEQAEDAFGIDEVTIFEGEHDEKVYSVSGDILDATLYDLFMNMLHERGISNDFLQQLSHLCTSYEHSQYITLLEKVKGFVERK